MNTLEQLRARCVIGLWPAHQVIDGDGVRINRNAFAGKMQLLDPFLMLDEIVSDDANDYIGGFPEHPHRGFETVTYMLEGKMQHRDHMGNTGELVSGSVQWMTAGRGVLHSEMPQQQSGRLHGFQLWVNLPAKDKLCDPNYQEYQPQQIPMVATTPESTVKVIAGELRWHQNGHWQTPVAGPVQGITTAPTLYDIQLAPRAELKLHSNNQDKTLLYVYQGETEVIGDQTLSVAEKHMALLDNGDLIQLKSEQGSRLLLLAGKPLHEPIAHWGPFVMNTSQEIEQAVADYRDGKLV